MRFREKVVIITGAKSGIGLATALSFADEGAKVVIADIRDARQVVSLIASKGGEALFFKVDVSNENQIEELIDKTIASYGRIDILINNAGIVLAKKVTETTEEEWDRLMNVNLKGVFLCAKTAIPVMKHNGGGVIINVASELGLVGGSEIAAYCASKGGVIQLTKAMAIDHASDNIRVNCVCPGPVDTSLLEKSIVKSTDFETERKRIAEKTLLKRLGKPKEIASVILFIASDESSYMTGSVIVVDGGWSAR